MAWIPDVPEETDIQLRRAAFIRRKLIDRLPDEAPTGGNTLTGSNSSSGCPSSGTGTGSGSGNCGGDKEHPIVYTDYFGATSE